MFSIKEINETITQGQSLKFLTQSYSEVAATRLKRIRNGIEKNRSFLNDLATMYSTIKLVAVQKNLRKAIPSISPLLNTTTEFILRGGTLLPKTLRKAKGEQAKKSPSSINVLLTSNHRFYGGLDKNLIEFFLKHGTRSHVDSIVVGRTGIENLKIIRFTPFQPVVFAHDFPTPAELRNLTLQISKFDRVLVYHAKFQSVLSQIPFIKDIKEAQFEVSIPKKRIDYIFEPEIDKMLSFFDTQISSILLEQTFLESELARTAARLISMNNAEDNANTFIGGQRKLLAQAKRSLENIHLLDTFAGSFRKRKKTYENN